MSEVEAEAPLTGVEEYTEVEVENFQSIKKATLRIRGFTVVTGRNNSGKTALMRALKGAVQNTPGTGLVRWGEGRASTSIRFRDGDTLKWSKGEGAKAKPSFVVNDGKPIYPGKVIPEEVRDLGVRPIRAGGRDIWPQIADQFDGQVFLLNEPGSVLAEAVADVERVTLLNDALRMSESDRRAASNKLKVRREDRDEVAEQLEEYEGLDGALELLEAAKASCHQAQRFEKAIMALKDIQERLEAAQVEVTYLAPIEAFVLPQDPSTLSQALLDLGVLRDIQVRLGEAQSEVEYLVPIEAFEMPVGPVGLDDVLDELGVLRDLQVRLDEAQGAVKRLEPVETFTLPGDPSKLTAALDELTNLRDLQARYLEAQGEVERLSGVDQVSVEVPRLTQVDKVLLVLGILRDLQGRYQAAQEEVDLLQREQADVDAELAETEEEITALLAQFDACPTCGAEVAHAH